MTVPIAALLALGIFISLRHGKGSAWFGVMCLLMGVLIASTQVGLLLRQLVSTASQSVASIF